MGNKPTHNLSLVTKYKDKNGEEKSRFTQITAWWVNDNWGVFYEIPKGMLITGTLLSSPVKDRVENKQETLDESIDDDVLFW